MIFAIFILATIGGIVGLVLLLKSKRKGLRRVAAVLLAGAAAVYLIIFASILWLVIAWH